MPNPDSDSLGKPNGLLVVNKHVSPNLNQIEIHIQNVVMTNMKPNLDSSIEYSLHHVYVVQ